MYVIYYKDFIVVYFPARNLEKVGDLMNSYTELWFSFALRGSSCSFVLDNTQRYREVMERFVTEFNSKYYVK